jgi:hypothetical protein
MRSFAGLALLLTILAIVITVATAGMLVIDVLL